MDEIAALAGVSKQTVYKQFADKQSLFSEIVISTVEEVAEPIHAEVLALQDSGDLGADLRGLARQLLGMVMQPRILQLRRLVIGEAGRFPELGRTFYEQGPGARSPRSPPSSSASRTGACCTRMTRCSRPRTSTGW